MVWRLPVRPFQFLLVVFPYVFLLRELLYLQPSGESIAPIIASLVNGFSLFESSIVVLHVRTGTSVFAEVCPPLAYGEQVGGYEWALTLSLPGPALALGLFLFVGRCVVCDVAVTSVGVDGP